MILMGNSSVERSDAARLTVAAGMLDISSIDISNARKIWDATWATYQNPTQPTLLDIWNSLPRDGAATWAYIVTDGKFFTVDQAGDAAYIIPAGWRDDEPSDLLAVNPATPDTWYWLEGRATWLIEPNPISDEIILQPTPWSWVRSGFKGTCAFHNAALLDLHFCTGSVICASMIHAQHIRNVFKSASLEAPKLLVPRG